VFGGLGGSGGLEKGFRDVGTLGTVVRWALWGGIEATLEFESGEALRGG